MKLNAITCLMVYRQRYHIVATQKKEVGEPHEALQRKDIRRILQKKALLHLFSELST